MKNAIGYGLIILSAIFLFLAVLVIAKEVHYSLNGLLIYFGDSALLGRLVAIGIGAALPGMALGLIGFRLINKT